MNGPYGLNWSLLIERERKRNRIGSQPSYCHGSDLTNIHSQQLYGTDSVVPHRVLWIDLFIFVCQRLISHTQPNINAIFIPFGLYDMLWIETRHCLEWASYAAYHRVNRASDFRCISCYLFLLQTQHDSVWIWFDWKAESEQPLIKIGGSHYLHPHKLSEPQLWGHGLFEVRYRGIQLFVITVWNGISCDRHPRHIQSWFGSEAYWKCVLDLDQLNIAKLCPFWYTSETDCASPSDASSKLCAAAAAQVPSGYSAVGLTGLDMAVVDAIRFIPGLSWGWTTSLGNGQFYRPKWQQHFAVVTHRKCPIYWIYFWFWGWSECGPPPFATTFCCRRYLVLFSLGSHRIWTTPSRRLQQLLVTICC